MTHGGAVDAIAGQTLDEAVPLGVLQRREEAREYGERVGQRAAELTAVHTELEDTHLDDAVDEPSQGGGDRWLADGPVF